MTDVNLYTNLGGYFELSCAMAEFGNMNEKFGVTLCIFIMTVVDNSYSN
jgi:hypothetical protein